MPPASRSRKVKAVRISYERRASSATPLQSSSVSDDWLRSALSISGRAAFADDQVAHHAIPSIKAIVDIFTQMVEQLEGMKMYRDDLYEVTNEIKSLIDLVVHYAREHESTSQRFVGACNDFLSTVSSMQCEIQKLFGGSQGPNKRSAKAKICLTILASYRSRLRRLHSDIQASTPSSSSATFFSNATRCTITGGELTNVGGNQYIFHIHETTDIQALLDRTRGLDDPDVSDFRVFKYGDLYAITTPQMKYRSHSECNGQDIVQEQYITCIGNEIKTARTYGGNCTLKFKKFKDDIRIIQDFKHKNILQIFGVCLSKRNPTIIFHGKIENLRCGRHLHAQERLRLKFRMFREWQDACHYLIKKNYEQFSDMLAKSKGHFLFKGYRDNYSWYLYSDHRQHLQLSIESPTNGFMRDVPVPSFSGYSNFSLYEMEAIENGLSHGTIPNRYQIDRKACLIKFYYSLITRERPSIQSAAQFILISPMRHAGAARLTFDSGCYFKWQGWHISPNASGPSVKMSNVIIENTSWTRFTIPGIVSSERHPRSSNICYYSEFRASGEYLEAYLAQAERILSQIRSLCTSSCEDTMLVTKVRCKISFQSSFLSPFQDPGPVFLFVENLQDVDDAFEIKCFFATDPTGLERLSQRDMLALGLDEPRLSRIRLGLWYLKLPELEELRIFHELFGYAADSLDVALFLNLPLASVKWDGDENGPLTPWESLKTIDKRLFVPPSTN